MALPETFTGENGLTLNAYSALWVSNAAHTGVMEIQSGRAVIRATPAATACYLYDQSPASADYPVESTFRISSGTANGGLVIRASKSEATFYQFRWNAGSLQIYKFIAGAATQLGGDVTHGLSLNTDYLMCVECSGNDIIGYIDGVERIRRTDTSITAIGYGGIRVNSGNTGISFDGFNVGNMGGGSVDATATGSATASGTANATLDGPTTLNAAASGAAVASGTADADLTTPTIVSEPLYDNVTPPNLLANVALTYAAVYHPDTGALVVRKTGISTGADGRYTFTDAALSAGVNYLHDWLTVSGHRRMPVKAAS